MALLAGTLLATGPARAGLIYNFSFIPTGSVTTPINTISGTFEVDASTIIDITGNASYGGAITGLLPPGVFFGNDNIFSDTAPYLTFDGVSLRGVARPIRRKLAGSFSLGVAGGGKDAAAAASSP
ncbi:MAG TPA: hypothetical protein PLL92_03520 [Alicycliphilus sp.]|nr:hypothetical protein [Alicycliphilus sp.]